MKKSALRLSTTSTALFALFVPFSILPTSLCASQPQEQPPAEFETRAPFVPTPLSVVRKMLELAEVGPDDVVYDLGSGDGRIVIMAAKEYGARAVGVEISQKLAEESSQRIREQGLAERAKIIQGDMFKTNVAPATVVTLYLLTIVNERLRPLLEKQLRHGARVVSHEFRVPGWEPKKVVEAKSEAGLTYTLYLYVRP